MTLPLASSTIWNDPLENPLSDIKIDDEATGGKINLGSLTGSFYALCWTERESAKDSDWYSFSRGKEAVRITATVGDLMGRLMRTDDRAYMHRTWIADVEYLDPAAIQSLKTSDEVFRRMESSGAMLPLSATIVRDQFSHENEIRLLFDPSVHPRRSDIIFLDDGKLIRIPFDWSGFVKQEEFR